MSHTTLLKQTESFVGHVSTEPLHGPVRVGAHMGPYRPIYGPILAFMGPYMGPCGPLWVHIGPYGSPGQVLAGPDMSDFRLLVEFHTFRVQK